MGSEKEKWGQKWGQMKSRDFSLSEEVEDFI